MDERLFWIKFWFIMGCIIITIAALNTLYTANSERLVLEAIKSGVDPIMARCAISDTNSDVCKIKVGK